MKTDQIEYPTQSTHSPLKRLFAGGRPARAELGAVAKERDALAEALGALVYAATEVVDGEEDDMDELGASVHEALIALADVQATMSGRGEGDEVG